MVLDWCLGTLGVDLTPPGPHSLGSMLLNPNLGLFRVVPPKSHLPCVTGASSSDLGGATHLESLR